MATINGLPYTAFRAVSVKDGQARLEDPFVNTTYIAKPVSNYGVRFEVAKSTLTANRKIYLGDGSGSMMIKGYDITFGTTSFIGDSSVAAQTVAQAAVTISGVNTTSVVLVQAATSAQVAGYVPTGCVPSAADTVWVFYKTQAATAATATVPISYMILNPQTN